MKRFIFRFAFVTVFWTAAGSIAAAQDAQPVALAEDARTATYNERYDKEATNSYKEWTAAAALWAAPRSVWPDDITCNFVSAYESLAPLERYIANRADALRPQGVSVEPVRQLRIKLAESLAANLRNRIKDNRPIAKGECGIADPDEIGGLLKVDASVYLKNAADLERYASSLERNIYPPDIPDKVEAIKYPALARSARIIGNVVIGDQGELVSGHPLLAGTALESWKSLGLKRGVVYHFELTEPVYSTTESKVKKDVDYFDRFFLWVLHISTEKVEKEHHCVSAENNRSNFPAAQIEIWVVAASACLNTAEADRAW